jgi:signal transduction histidine kinase
MRERVALVDGRLEIESSEGLGTTILVEVPVQ